MSNRLEEQRVLMGIDQWDRPMSIDEKRAHKSNTAKYIASAMEMLQKARKSAGHRRLKKENKDLFGAISTAYEACGRAHEACYQHGETYEVEEGIELAIQLSEGVARDFSGIRTGISSAISSIRSLSGLFYYRLHGDGVRDMSDKPILDASQKRTAQKVYRGLEQMKNDLEKLWDKHAKGMRRDIESIDKAMKFS
jgi:hypothetical protein